MEVFRWLKSTTRSRQVFVARHMRLDDPADPAQWNERSRAISAMQDRISERERQAHERKHALSKLCYHARKLQDAGPEADVTSDWKVLLEATDRLLAMGVKASAKEIRELVIPIEDRLPEGIPVTDGWRQVDRHIDEYLALLEAEQVEQRPVRQRSPEVETAAELLRGRRMVLIGGQERPRSREALIRELELGDLAWITSAEHASLDTFEPDIIREDTDVVVLMIRWTSHSHGGVRKFCEDHDKLFVRLPGGYSPNQVAGQVMSQIGERLRQRAAKRSHDPERLSGNRSSYQFEAKPGS